MTSRSDRRGGARKGAGRPKARVTPEQEAKVRERADKAGSQAVAEETGVPRSQVLDVWRQEGVGRTRVPWSEADDAYLREHAGEQSVPRLARELQRTQPAIRARLHKLGLSIKDMRPDLTVAEVAAILGRNVEWVRRRIHSRELAGRHQDGAFRVWPSAIRELVRRDPSAPHWPSVGDWQPYLTQIIAGDV